MGQGIQGKCFDEEFNGDKVIGQVDVSDNKISFRTTIKWGLGIERIDGHPSPDLREILKVVDHDEVDDDTEEPKEDEDSEELKKGEGK